jgi:membrane protease YdiL (CAAX protease family)
VFTLRLGLSLIAAALAAALVAPLVAPVLAWAGFNFPFPRIFDRVVMVTLALAIWRESRELHLVRRLRAGFSKPLAGLPAAASGVGVGAAAMAVLWALAWLVSRSSTPGGVVELLIMLAKNLAAALTIAVLEEGFFRAFLLDGMAGDFGVRGALVASSAVYAIAHLIRSPARFHVTTFQPLVGLETLAASAGQLTNVYQAAPALLGLFLLGLVLGRAFIETGRVYFSIGLHASLIVGVKTWRKLAPGAQTLPAWLSGYSRPPLILISGAPAWLITIVLLILVGRLTRRYRPSGRRQSFTPLIIHERGNGA